MRLLFYAINGVGLGHVSRLSVLATHLHNRHKNIRMSFYSNSVAAEKIFPMKGDTIVLPDNIPPQQRARVAYSGFKSAVEAYQPQIIVCDTHWPRPAIGLLRQNGTRTVLVLRLVSISRAKEVIIKALQDFDLIIIPHSPTEVYELYKSSPEIIKLLAGPKFLISGPIARLQTGFNKDAKVVFSLGGGGEYHNGAGYNSTNTLLDQLHASAKILSESGYHCVLACGPFLKLRPEQEYGWNVFQTLHLHESLGERTVSVGRAGYNTCWEALGSGGKLVLVGSHSGYEDVAARHTFLTSRKLAVTAIGQQAIVDAVKVAFVDKWDAAYIKKKSAVNIGLEQIVNRMIYG